MYLFIYFPCDKYYANIYERRKFCRKVDSKDMEGISIVSKPSNVGLLSDLVGQTENKLSRNRIGIGLYNVLTSRFRMKLQTNHEGNRKMY